MTPETRVYTAKNGDEYRFIFNHRGLIAAEKASDGMGLGKLLAALGEGGYGAVGAFLKGGLTVNHPEITLDDAFDLWEEEGPKLVEAMGEALGAAMPTIAKMLGVSPGPPKGAKPTPPTGTGTRSSARGAKQG